MNKESQRQFLINYAVDQMTAFLIEDRNISLEQALSTIYSSRVYDLLQDTTIDLVADSPSYLYELLKSELTTVEPKPAPIKLP